MIETTGIEINFLENKKFVPLDYNDTSHLYRSGRMGGLLGLHYFGAFLPADIAETKGEELYIGCSLHDVGKSKFVDRLEQWEKLSEAERKEIKEGHILESVELLKEIGVNGHIADAIRHHHQRWNGEGSYPFKLSGFSISTEGLIASLVDYLDSLVNTRRFKEHVGALSPEEAFREIEKRGRDMFGPFIVDSFAGMVEQNEKRQELAGYLQEERGSFTVNIPEKFIVRRDIK